MDLLNRITAFFRSRYGRDQLNLFLFGVFFVLLAVNAFAHSWIITLIELVPLGLMLFRMLSKNVYKRMDENRRFLAFMTAVGAFFKNLWLRIKNIRNYRYRVCPRCKAQLRLTKKYGRHTVRCPKCGNEFKVIIL